jgi:hypothetical protein
MLVSTRISLVAMVVAVACADPGPTSGGDDDDGTQDVRIQCAAPVACPAPTSATKQSLCGQIYNFENNDKLLGSSSGACTATTESGPCALTIKPHDAIAFAQNPAQVAPLAHGSAEIDGCGRFRITDIDTNAIGPFIALAVDDAAHVGPPGSTVTVAIATPKVAGTATDQLEAWVVKESTTTQWAASGGPALMDGVFVPVFRAHKLGTPETDPFEPQSGVTFTSLNTSLDDYYFGPEAVDRMTIDAAAVATGANGTVLVRGASIQDAVAHSGTGGLSDTTNCRWPRHAGMTSPGVVFIQLFRPTDQVGAQCPL